MQNNEVYASIDHAFLNSVQEETIRALFREHFDTEVSLRFEFVPEDERDRFQPMSYMLHIEFQQDFPPDFEKFADGVFKPLREILSTQAIGCSFADFPSPPYARNCVSVHRIDKVAMEEKDIKALYEVFKQHGLSIDVGFFKSSGILCRGLSMDPQGVWIEDVWDEMQAAVGTRLYADRVSRADMLKNSRRGEEKGR